MSDKQQQLFKTRFVPGKAGSGKLFEEEFVFDDGPVECLWISQLLNGKPNWGFEARFPNETTTEEGVWDFVRTHLKYLPVTKRLGSDLIPVPERNPLILFDQMVAYYIRKGYPVPISSQKFQLRLVQRFPERDGMYFLSDQTAEYDKKRYLLCLQPVCDSVRMGGKSRAFIFCVLDKSANNGLLTYCVMDDSGNVIQLRYKPKVSSIFVSNFKGNDDAVYSNKDEKDRFIFKGQGKKDYEWIAELKTEYAQRAAEQFGRELSRVGLTESEWLRIKGK